MIQLLTPETTNILYSFDQEASVTAYAGIGARKNVPAYIEEEMIQLGAFLARKGWTLRSGAATGSDTHFETGCDGCQGDKQIFLPWERFNNHPSWYVEPPQGAYELIDKLFGDAKFRSSGTRALWARNCQQILGPNLDDPSKFVVCWTKNGQAVGGTGRAIKVANHFGIPVINLYNPRAAQEIELYL